MSNKIIEVILIPANTDIQTRRQHYADLRKKLTIPEGGHKIPVEQLQSFVNDHPAVLACIVREDKIHTFVDASNRDSIAYELNICSSCLRVHEYEPPNRIRRLTQLIDSAKMIRKLIDPSSSPAAKLTCELFDDRINKVSDIVD